MREVVIVGGGHNGLVAAAFLASAGLKPLVLERSAWIGGCAITADIAPGFRCPVLAHKAAIEPQIVRALHLERHGLRILRAPALVCAPAGHGRALTVWRDTAATSREIAVFSARDAERYPRFLESVRATSAVLHRLAVKPPPSTDRPGIADLFELFRTGRAVRGLARPDAYRLLRWLPMAIADFAHEWFESEPLCATVAAEGVGGAFAGPRSPGTAMALLWLAAGKGDAIAPGWTAEGGIGAVSEALAAAARQAGAEVRTGVEVSRILVQDGAATGVVLSTGEEIAARRVVSNADPRRTMLGLVGPEHLEPEYRRAVQNIRMRGTLATVSYAVSSLPAFSDLAGRDPAERVAAVSGCVRLCQGMDALERAFDAAKYGGYSDEPWIELGIPSVNDPGLAPAGCHVVSAHVLFAPYQLRGTTWDSERERLGDVVTSTIARYAPGFERSVIARKTITPLDLERDYGLTGGHAFHGEIALDQLLLARPLLGWSRYQTPIRNLFLCGTGTHPGTGLDGRAGWLAAREMGAWFTFAPVTHALRLGYRPLVPAMRWLLASALVCATEAAAQQPDSSERVVKSAVVTSTTATITIDGVLDEEIWRTAPGIGDLTQRQPNPGQAPTERTDVVLLHDTDNLYVGVIAYDSEPGRVIGTQMARDGAVNADDNVEILLDTFRDQRSAFYFATNPSGAFVDGLAANGQLNAEWDAIWDVRTNRTEQGWVAEFAIPFKSLSFPAGDSVWGFNISRTIYRKLEDARWSGARLETQFLQLSEAGQITNLEGLTQGLGLNVRPFYATRWLRFGDSRDDDFGQKPGLDLFYNLLPSLKLTGTFNTDFGETEVDARQINLSRFSLLFPEKRSFFLEGAGVFNFASTGPDNPGGIPASGADVYPFFSRRIGLLSGEEVPIDAGVKLTGTVGRTDVGMLDVRTGDLPLVDEKNFFVGRVKRNLFRQSYIGGIFTNGHPVLGQSGQTFGADMRLATSRFMGASRNLVVNAYGARSVNKDRSDKDWSYGFSAYYPNDVFVSQLVFREIQENFNPALGFVQRDNVRLFRVSGSYNPRPKRFLNILQMNHDVFYTRFTRLDNDQLESEELYVTWWDWHFRSGDNLHGILDFNPIYERLFEPFEISPGVVLLPGEYRFTRFKSNPFTTASKRPLSGSLNVTFGNYWSGRAEQWMTSVTYKLPPRFSVTLSTNQTFARLPEGDFTARIVTSTVNYAASPRLSLSNLVQFDNRSRNLGWQSRVRWTERPGNDLFFAFNQGWIQEEGGILRFKPQESKVSAKFQYTFRF